MYSCLDDVPQCLVARRHNRAHRIVNAVAVEAAVQSGAAPLPKDIPLPRFFNIGPGYLLQGPSLTLPQPMLDVAAASTNQVERIACECLRRGFVSYDLIQQLCDALPSSLLRRGVHEAIDGTARSVSFGAFVFGNISAGLHQSTLRYPMCTRVFAQAIRVHSPSHRFDAISLLRQVRSTWHRDRNNLQGSSNLVIPASCWHSGGGVCIRRDSGEECIHAVIPHGCLFDPTEEHCTEEWTGSRTIIVAYSVRDSAILSVEHMRQLKELGFHVPNEPAQWDPYM